MCIFILGSANRPGVLEETERLVPLLQQHSEIVVSDLYQEKDLTGLTADMALVFGGDGSILRAALADGLSPDAGSGRQPGEARFPGRPGSR